MTSRCRSLRAFSLGPRSALSQQRAAWRIRQGLPFYCAVAAGLAYGALAAPLPKPAPPTTSATAGDIRLTLRRMETERSASMRLDGKGQPSESVRESLAVRLELQLSSRFPAMLATVRRGPVEPGHRFRITDNLGRSTRDVTAEVVDEEAGPVLRVSAQGLSPQASSLRALEGNLTLFPEAKLVRFHVPWAKDDLPLQAKSTGAVATLRRFQLVEEDSTLWISVRPPAGLRVAAFELPGSIEARAVDIHGNLVNNGGITEIEQVRFGAEPEYRFSAPAMRRTPDRLTLDVLCVGGAPIPRSFVLRELRLPIAPR